jgi:hypothetical protein
MENRKANLTVLVRSLLFFALFIISGCFSLAKIPDQSFKSSNDMAIVFGRLERLKNGQSVPHHTNLKWANRIFVDTIAENKNMAKTDHVTNISQSWEKLLPSKAVGFSKYVIIIRRTDGYFIATLPPGKYVVEKTSIYQDWGWGFLDDRTPHLVTFDVIPQKPTYIGTIQVIETVIEKEEEEYSVYRKRPNVFEEIYEGPAFGVVGMISSLSSLPGKTISKDEYMKLSSEEQGRYEEIKRKIEKRIYNFLGSWQIINELEEAKKVFTSLYPDRSELIEKLSEIKQDSTKK